MNLNQKIQSYLNEHKNAKKRLSATALLSLLIALAVVSSLIMPAISMTMASISSDAGENSSISLLTQATAGVPSTITDTDAEPDQTMLDLTSADKWTASLMCNDNYFYEATDKEVTTNTGYSTDFDEVTISAYIEYEFEKNVSSYLTGDGPHLGWDLGNPDFTAKFTDGDYGTVNDPNYTEGIAGTYVIENGFVKVTLTDEYIAFVNSGTGSIKGSLDFSGTLSQSNDGNGNQSFILNGQTVIVDFPDKYPTMGKVATVNADGTITWQVNINNAYNVDLSKYSFSDTMLTGAYDIKVSPDTAATVNGNSIAFTAESEFAQWIIITYKTDITEAELKEGSSTNSAKLNPNDGSSEIPAAQTAWLSNPFIVDKYGSADYVSGTYSGNINWTINVQSKYGTSLNGYIIEDTNIPDGTTLTASDGSTIESLGNGKWKLNTTNPSVTITYSAPATAGQTNSNTATLLYPDSTTTNATDKDDVTYDEVKNLITVDKTGYAVNSNGTISWTIKVKNPYGLSLNGDTVTDKMLSSAVGTVDITPSGSGTHSGGAVTLSGNASEITITYVTNITDAQLNAKNADNDVTLKHGDDPITDEADVPLPDPFDVTKNGTPDYESGTYDHKINWTVTIKSNYSTSLDGYYISDSQLPADATGIEVTGGTLTYDSTEQKWKLSNTSGSTVTIKYQSAAADGNNANSVDLYYSENVDDDTDLDEADGADTTVEYKDESGIITLNKGATFDTTDGLINWTISISNQKGINLNGYTITDLMLVKAVDDAVTFSPEGAGTYDSASGLVTLTDVTEGERNIIIRYSTAITETELKNGGATNKATLKNNSDTDGTNDDTVGTADKTAGFTAPYFTITKTGKQDYDGGSYGNKITWTIKVESKYGSSLDGYILTDTLNNVEMDLSTATVSPSGSVSADGVLSGTNGANTVYITYTTPAAGGTTYNNEVGLGYSDGTSTGATGSSGDVEYKSNDDLVNLYKYGYYDKDTRTIRWTINVNLLGGTDDCTLTDERFPATLAELTFSPDISGCANLSGNTLTITDSTTSSFTIQYTEDVSSEVFAGTTVIENKVNDTTATVPVENRNELTKSLNSNGYETINSNGVVVRTLNWIANITRDSTFAGQVYTDKLEAGVTDAEGTAITGDSSTHTITNEQLAAIVVKAKTTQYGNETTLVLGTDYTITRSDNGFCITFNDTLDKAGYNYVTITYSTTATAGAVTTDKYPVTYVFGNSADFAGNSADGGDFTLVKNNPVLKTTLDFTASKNWQNDTYADRPDSIYIKVWYYTNKDSTWRTLRGSGTDYIYYGDDDYSSASDYIIEIPKDANNNWQSSTLTGLYKEVALPEADGTRGTSTYYYYKIEEVNKVTDASGNVTYESIANNSFDTSNGTYEVTYSNNNGINYSGSATVANKFHRTTAVTPVKNWAGDTGTSNGMLSVTVRLEYSVDGGSAYYPVEISSGKYVFDLGAETADTSVLTQNVNITADWKGTTWDSLPTAMIVDGTLKTVSYRIVETAYTTASGTTDINGSRFAVDGGYYVIGTSGCTDGNGGQQLTVTNTFNATEQLSVNANKVWSGDESEEYIDNRPDAILVKLQQRSSATYQWTDYVVTVTGEDGTEIEVLYYELSEDNNWSYEWDVPNQSVAEDGTSIDYSYRVVEVGYVKYGYNIYFNDNQTSFAVTSEGKYVISYNNGNQWNTTNELSQGTGGTITVTNTFAPVGTIDITPQKEWIADTDEVRPTSVIFKLQQRIGSSGDWKYVDTNGNLVSDVAQAATIELTAEDKSSTEWDTNVVWTGDTLSGLPEKAIVIGDNGTYTEPNCWYRFIEYSYTLNGSTTVIDQKSDFYSTTYGTYEFVMSESCSSGLVKVTNEFSEDVGITKSAFDSEGNVLPSTLEIEELDEFKYTLVENGENVDYYIFNWMIKYDLTEWGDGDKLPTIKDTLPDGFELVYDNSWVGTSTGTKYSDYWYTSDLAENVNYLLDTKYQSDYILHPAIIYPDVKYACGAMPAGSIADIYDEYMHAVTMENPDLWYYYDTSNDNNDVYFNKYKATAPAMIYYSIKIKCTDLEAKLATGSHTITNTAYTYNDTSANVLPAEREIIKSTVGSLKIISPVDTDLITKTYEGKTNTPGEIKFSLNINPEGKNLSTGSTIDIQDVFNTISYLDADIGSGGTLYDAVSNPDNYQKLVDVLMSNIKLYEVDANGNKLELSSSDYTLLFATGDETGNGALMQLTVPDEKHIVIDYTYKLIANEDTPSVENGCKSSTRVNGRYATMAPGFVPPANDQINFTNTATLKADSATDESTISETNYTVFKSSGTISTNSLPKIKKVKTSDYSIDTLGASFMLAKCENGKWYYSTAIDEEGAITWGTDGMDGIKVSSEAQAITINGDEDFPVALDENILYKVIEMAYPTEGGKFEGSNLFPDLSEIEAKAQFSVLILNYLNDGSTFIGDKDYSIFLENYISTHYFAYNSTISSYPSEVDPDTVIQVKVGENVEIPNNELIDIAVNKNWINPQSDLENTEITVELYWSYEKSASTPAVWYLADAADLGIMDQNFSAEKTLTITLDEDGNLITSDTLWTDLPNGKNDKPIYYYIKETSYKIGDTTYVWNESSEKYESSSGTGTYLPTYIGNAANTSGTIDVRNSYQLMLKKEWKNSSNDPLRNIPVDKVIVSIYGIDKDGAMTSTPLFTDVEISASNDWTTDITDLLSSVEGGLSQYTSFVAEESAGSSLDGYVVSCVFNLNADTGEIIVTNKNTTPTEASVTVDKAWSDGDAMHANDSITVTLYQLDYELSNLDDLDMKLPDDSKMSAIDENDTQQYVDVVLNADNDWQYIWTGLPLEDDEQNKYYYYVLETVTEKAADGSGVANADKYTASYVITSQTATNTVFQVINTRRSISIQKQWLDEDGYDISNEIDIESIELEVLKKVPGVPADGIDILAFGDSITAGDGNSGAGYTGYLKSELESDTYNFTVNNAWKCGHSGWAIMALPGDYDKTGDTRSTWESRSGIYDQISSDFSGKSPDVVTLMIGTNDIISNYPNNIEVRLEKLIKAIYTNQSSNPNMVILVGSIPDFDFVDSSGNAIDVNTWFDAGKGHNRSGEYADLQTFENYINNTVIDGYNKKIETLVKKLANEGYRIGFVDINSVVDKDTELSDGCHPNDTGNQDMAEEWAEAIADYYTQTPKVGDITLTAENNWMASFDIASSDTSSEYYVNESSIPTGWAVIYENQNQTMGSATPITVKNTRNIPKTSLSVEKVWENDSGNTNARDSISLSLLQSIDQVDWFEYDVDMPAPTKSEDGDTWTYSYTGLPAEDNNGNQYYYKIVEDPMAGYTTKYNVNILEAVDGGNAGTMQITNTRAVSLKLKKDWSDYDPETNTHIGDTVTLKIYRGLLANGRGDDYSGVDLVLQVTPKNLGITVGGEAATITANKALTADGITPSEGYEEFITYKLEDDGKTITITAIKETDTPVTLTVTDGVDTEIISITASAYTLYYDGEKTTSTSTPSMRVNETGHKLSVKKGSSTYTDVKYVSNNESVLTVDAATGEITGVNIGTASVSVYTNDNLTTPIFIQDIAVGLPETFEIVQKTGTTQEVTIGSSIQLGVDKNYGTFTWESKDTTKATVSVEEDGTVKVTGVAAGSVTITATRAAYGNDEALTKEYTINVENGDIFENDNVVVRVPVGESVTLTSDTPMSRTWIEGSSTNIATASLSNGIITVTGVGAGEVKVGVQGGQYNNENVYFTVIVYEKFGVSPATKTLAYGGTVTLTPNTTDAVTYTIKSGSNLIDISGNTVTAKSGTEGTAVIEAKNTATGETATVTIEVVAEIPEVQTPFSGVSTISIDNSKTISCIRVNLQHSGSNWEYITVKLDGSDSNKAKFGYNGALPLIMESQTCTNVNFEITDAQNGDVEITFIGDYQPSSISIENNGNVTPTGTVTVVYASTAASVSNLSLYGASMSNMLLGADADIEPAAEVLNYQLYTTVELEYNAAAAEGDKWTYVLDGLDVYDPSGKEYIYWVVEDPTFTNYSASYLFDDGDGTSDYWINAAEPNSDGEFVATVKNTKQESEGVTMPSTGGEGVARFYYTGGAMVLLALIAGSNRIRRRLKERRTK